MKHDPYDENLPPAPSFRIAGGDVFDGKEIPRQNASEGAGGGNVSPQLVWSNPPPDSAGMAQWYGRVNWARLNR